MAVDVEVSVVMPCLNEHETVGICVEKAFLALADSGLSGEVILADNGRQQTGRSRSPGPVAQ